MAFYVSVPRDLSRVKTKVFFHLTKRQLICFSLAAGVGFPVYFLAKDPLGSTAASLVMVISMMPLFLMAMYEKNGKPVEVLLSYYLESRFLRPKVRIYRTDNLYRELERKTGDGNGIIRESRRIRKQAGEERNIRSGVDPL